MKKENNVMVLNGVECFVDKKGMIQLKLENVARGLGFTQIKNGVEYVRWETVKGYLKGFEFSQDVGKETFIPEPIFYLLAMKADNVTAREFQKMVAFDILPSIRQNGGYISDSATPEQVEKLVEHHSFVSITKQIVECDIMRLEDLVKEILDINLATKKKKRDKYHQDLTDAKYKIKINEHVKKAIESRIMPTDASYGIEIAVRYKLTDVLNKQALSTTRRSNGKVIAHKDKQIKELKEGYEDKLIWLDYAPFSVNYMYTNTYTISDAYKKWMHDFPHYKLENICKFNDRVNSDMPMRLVVEVITKEGQDTDNTIKSLQDRLQDYYGFDDIYIKDINIKNVGTVKRYKDCKIGYYLENIEQHKKPYVNIQPFEFAF